MNIFTSFNRKSIDDRQIDTLIGVSKGLTADGAVNQAGAEFLLTWLAQARSATDNPVIANLFSKVSEMLEDGHLDNEESQELLRTLHLITGDKSEIGEMAKTSNLPVCNPAPSIVFESRIFLFTGTCVYGTRKECQAAIESLGGACASSVNKSLDYLILGTYVTDSWAHENYGRKIEKAMQYRDQGVPLAIVTEEHWLKSANLGG